ncbi:hypothetical protein FNF27_00975 [Cafeteria roenbergensis]|uniref:Uncharacterized protein n=2 Tax=Cafeteria roenbergensis TaxID=33653 RepID=A0A5A8EKJ4_CAFRO|nr:hypothetical protein FNF27_00975 [Cafeteria roenbergensis]
MEGGDMVEFCTQYVQGMVAMGSLAQPRGANILERLASGDASRVSSAMTEVMGLLSGTTQTAEDRPPSVDPISRLQDSAAINILYFLEPQAIGRMAQVCTRLSKLVTRLRPRLFRVHAYRLLFDADLSDASAGSDAKAAEDAFGQLAAAHSRSRRAALGLRPCPLDPDGAGAIAEAEAEGDGGAGALEVAGGFEGLLPIGGGEQQWLPVGVDAPAGAAGAAADPGAAFWHNWTEPGIHLGKAAPVGPAAAAQPGFAGGHLARGAGAETSPPGWVMAGPVVLPSMLSAFNRVFGSFANLPADAARRRPGLTKGAPRLVERVAWDALVRAFTPESGGVGLRLKEARRAAEEKRRAEQAERDAAASSRSSSSSSSSGAAAAPSWASSSVAASAAGAAAAAGDSAATARASSGVPGGEIAAFAFPKTADEPPMDPFEWWRFNRFATLAGRRRSLMALDTMRRLSLPFDSEAWIRISSYVVPDVNAEQVAAAPQRTAMPGLGGTHSYLESGAGDREDGGGRAGPVVRSTKRLPLALQLDQLEVSGQLAQWLRIPIVPKLETIFVWSRAPHKSELVVQVTSRSLNERGQGSWAVSRGGLVQEMFGRRARELEALTRRGDAEAAWRHVMRTTGDEAAAKEAADEAAASSRVEYVPSRWGSRASPVSAELNMASVQAGVRVAAQISLIGADLTRAAGMLLCGNARAFFGSGGMVLTHSGRYGGDIQPGSSSGPEMVSTPSLNNEGIGQFVRGIVDLPVASLWWAVRLPFEEAADDEAIEALAFGVEDE